jgi:hypothetical protein
MSIANIKVVDIQIASAMDDVNQAVNHLQQIASLDGRAAAELDDKKWKAADRSERVELLRAWLKIQKAHEND